MSASAQQSFRSQLSGFRWANSVQDDSAAAAQAQAQQASNPLSRAWNSMSGYIPLRNEGRSQEEEAYFALSVCHPCPFRSERLVADDIAMGAVSETCWRWEGRLMIDFWDSWHVARAAWLVSVSPSSSCPFVSAVSSPFWK